MANIFTSSIGKKLIMSITGAFLILFLTFHMIMNGALVFSDDAYNAIVNFLGANWYALVGTVILAAGVVFHFVYAIVLTVGNLRARGKVRYAETKRENGVEWSSKNMFVLGLVVLGGLLLHLFNFWYNMQWTEIIGRHRSEGGCRDGEVRLLARRVCHRLYRMARGALVPPHARYVEHDADRGMEQQGVDEKAEVHRLYPFDAYRRLFHADSHYPVCTEPDVVLTNR